MNADYIKPTKETESQKKAWRTGGLRFILGLLVKEFGIEKVEEDLKLIRTQKRTDDFVNILKTS